MGSPIHVRAGSLSAAEMSYLGSLSDFPYYGGRTVLHSIPGVLHRVSTCDSGWLSCVLPCSSRSMATMVLVTVTNHPSVSGSVVTSSSATVGASLRTSLLVAGAARSTAVMSLPALAPASKAEGHGRPDVTP